MGILDEYKQQRPTYTAFSRKASDLVSDLLEKESIRTFEIAKRSKEAISLREKLARKGFKYNNLREITDLAGLRIICLTQTDVERAAGVIRKHFKIYNSKSNDTRLPPNPEEFGYASLHLVGKIKAERAKLPEWSAFKNLWIEIQIRTLLQHNWAAIVHKLGYKTEQDVPYHIRRKFGRLAGLLETADEQFDRIVVSRQEYKQAIAAGMKSEDQRTLDDTTLDLESLTIFYEGDKGLKALDKQVAKKMQAKLESSIKPEDIEVGRMFLEHHGVKTLGEVRHLLVSRYDEILKLVGSWKPELTAPPVRRGITFFFLGMLMVGNQPLDKIELYIEKFPILSGETVGEVANRIKNLAEEVNI